MRKNINAFWTLCVTIICILLIVIIRASTLQAQANQFRFKHLTVDDGLSQNLVHTILQDHKGFIWFGTKDGLNRYDGYQFTIFRHNPFDSTTISGHEIKVLHEDKAGYLWIGTTGLNRFDPRTETFTRYVYDSTNANSLSHNDVRAIAEDHNGTLWISTANGLNRLDPNRKAGFTRFFHDPNNPQSLSDNHIGDLLVDHNGSLWIGTEKGLNALLPGSTNGFIRYRLKDDVIMSLFEDSHGILWIGTVSGLSRLDDTAGTVTFKHYPHASGTLPLDWRWSIMDIEEGEAGKLWVGTLGCLLLFNPLTGTYQCIRHESTNSYSLNFDAVISIYKDRGGIVWFGTSGKGINKLDPNTKPFNHYGGTVQAFSAQSDFSVKAILEDQTGLLWVSANDYLYQFDREKSQWRRFHDITLPVGQIAEDRQGVLWFSTGIGFYRLSQKSSQISLLPINPQANENIWMITTDGIQNQPEFIQGLPSYHKLLKEGISINRIYRHANGILWLASNTGLIRFNPADSSFFTYRNDPQNPWSLSYDVVYSILPDPHEPNQLLWLGTAGGGLNCFNMVTEQFTHYTVKDGLPNNVIYGILPDRRGRLWMSTNRGLSAFDLQTRSFRNYDIHDGLQSNEFNRSAYFLSQKNEMFFGGINGLNAFYPDSIRDNPHAPPIVITDFQLAYQSVSFRDPESPLKLPISETEEIRLAHDQNTIAFEFAALDFTEPMKNRFAYKLENFNSQWVQARTSHRATYTNLPPDNYIFRVKGANNDGVWNETGTSIRIIITPPLWKRWWAYACYIIFAIASVIGIIKSRIRQLEKRTQQLETAVEERTAEVVAHEKQLAIQAEQLLELDRIKSNFFANVSHEFRTPLTLILGPLDLLLSKITKDDIKRELRRIQKNAQRLLRLVNQLLDISRLETGKMTIQVSRGNIVPLLRRITMSFASLADQKHISLNFISEADQLMLYFDQDKIEKIFYNLLSNAFKFTPERGEINVQVAVVQKRESGTAGEQESQSSPTHPLPLSPDHPDEERFVLVTIKDTGIGIAAERLAHIFDRFYQVDQSITREYEGTGIGLSLVRELVNLHHGSIAVSSAEGEGSAFTVSLPMGREMFSEDEIVDQVRPTQSSAGTSVVESFLDIELPRPTAVQDHPEYASGELDTIVLVVEDHADVRAYIREYLETSYKVIEAGDGAEGLVKAQECIPDLIVGDVMMPKMDGYEMCQALKTDERTSHIPVILLTARAALEDKLTGLKIGADDYLVKPFEAAELLSRVKNLIESRRKLRERWKQTVVLKPGEIATTSIDQAFLEKALEIAEKNLGDEDFSIEAFACQVGMSRSQLHRKLHALTNQSASLFLRSVRLLRAAQLLRQRAGTVAEITYQVGFSSQAYFTRCFKEQFGCSPKEYAGKWGIGDQKF